MINPRSHETRPGDFCFLALQSNKLVYTYGLRRILFGAASDPRRSCDNSTRMRSVLIPNLMYHNC
jgi:hypothetical protein